jgi:hypothetical protein
MERNGHKMKKSNKIVSAFIVITGLLIVLVACISACVSNTSTPDINPETGDVPPVRNNTPAIDDYPSDTNHEPVIVNDPPDTNNNPGSPDQNTTTITTAAEAGPIDVEIVENCVLKYMQLIADGDTTELARFLLIDGGVTDRYIAIAERVIEYYSQYDSGNVSVINIDYDEATQRYIILVRDGYNVEFSVYAQYGDSLLGIDVSVFDND